MKVMLDGNQKYEIEIEILPDGSTRVRYWNELVSHDQILRTGKLTFEVVPATPRRKRAKKPPAQDISGAGGIESEEAIGEF